MPLAEFVWLDLETTGLVPSHDVILEMGILLTNRYGDYVDQRRWLLNNKDARYKQRIEHAFTDTVVGPMHQKSGLWEAIQNDESVPVQTAAEDAIAWLDEHLPDHKEKPLCGNSVHFDRNFLETHCSILNAAFHYRNIDISTIKELCKELNPRIYGLLEKNTTPQRKHRVLPDLHDSAEEYKYYVDNFLWAVI